MTEQEIIKYAENLHFLYAELILANDGYKHDPEAHNLCSAVCQMTDGTNYEFVSYSNPSGLAINVRKYVLSSLIPNGKIINAIIQRGGMQDLHTEVRLLNYMADQGIFSKTGTVSFFSTRSICPTCVKAIGYAQEKFAKNIAFIPFELKAEDRWSSLSEVYAFLAEKGSKGMERRDADQASFKMDV